MSHTNKARLEAFLERVWNQGEIEAVELFIADQYTIFHDPGDPWHGQTLTRSEFTDRLVKSRSPFPDQTFSVQTMLENGHQVAANWTWKATHKGDIPGFPASGKTITMSGFTLYSFEKDRLCGHWQVCDRLGVFQQLQAG